MPDHWELPRGSQENMIIIWLFWVLAFKKYFKENLAFNWIMI